MSKPLHDLKMRPPTAATNVVQTAASQSQDHLCPHTFPVASTIIGYARLASLVGPVVFHPLVTE
jgi:hypothetical protein